MTTSLRSVVVPGSMLLLIIALCVVTGLFTGYQANSTDEAVLTKGEDWSVPTEPPEDEYRVVSEGTFPGWVDSLLYPGSNNDAYSNIVQNYFVEPILTAAFSLVSAVSLFTFYYLQWLPEWAIRGVGQVISYTAIAGVFISMAYRMNSLYHGVFKI